MPHATHAYPFEAKVFTFASTLAERFSAPGSRRQLLAVLGRDGGVPLVTLETPAEGWHAHLEMLRRQGTPFLSYDPFDLPEYCLISWAHIDQLTMERMIGVRFEASDFLCLRTSERELPVPGSLPATWSVMF